MIICALLIHYTALKALPEYAREVYIQSNTNTCQMYSKRSWDIVERNNAHIEVSNGVIEVRGYYFKQNKEK
jgi:hypothetical protein